MLVLVIETCNDRGICIGWLLLVGSLWCLVVMFLGRLHSNYRLDWLMSHGIFSPKMNKNNCC